jgi:hypothetical protein
MKPRNVAAIFVVSSLFLAASAYGWEELTRQEEAQEGRTEGIEKVEKLGGAEKPVDLHQAVTYNGASQAGAFEFREAGHELAGTLSCSGTDKGYHKMTITCRGTTKDSMPARLIANLTKDSTVVSGKDSRISDSNIFGTVGDNVVFHEHCIGEGCPKEQPARSDDDEKHDNDT